MTPRSMWVLAETVLVEAPYLVFIGEAHDALAAKTGFALVDWCPDRVLGQLRLPGCATDLGVPEFTPEEAAEQGARTLVIGTVSPGGALPTQWLELLCRALDAGMALASGMHQRLIHVPQLVEHALGNTERLIDVRHHSGSLSVGSGQPRPGKRLLTVGTDCSIGKKYTALALARGLQVRGLAADFRATGQTGILIAGEGIAVDAVVSDFVSGAAEVLSPAAADHHWDVVEGQGSLLHPSFAGVTLGLLQGSQPDAFVVCHEPTRTRMRNVDTPMPTPGEIIYLTIELGRRTNPDIRCVGIALNLSEIRAVEASALKIRLEAEHGVPVTDPVAEGVEPILDHLLADEVGQP